ncbi:MAG: hypothetical protein ACXWPM_07785 [Bdellovibrionota bacterium]
MKTKWIVLSVFLGAGALMQGCGSGPLSCSLPTLSQCIDFTGSSYTASAVTSGCAAGTPSTSSACTTTSRVGSCTINASNATVTSTYRYYSTGSAPFTATSAAAACTTLSGTFAGG